MSIFFSEFFLQIFSLFWWLSTCTFILRSSLFSLGFRMSWELLTSQSVSVTSRGPYKPCTHWFGGIVPLDFVWSEQCLKLMVAPGNQKLGWTSEIWPWASKNYNKSYKKGNFRNISGRLNEKLSLKHWASLTIGKVKKPRKPSPSSPKLEIL